MNDKSEFILQRHDVQIAQTVVELESINHNINLFKTQIQEVCAKYEEVNRLTAIHQKYDEDIFDLKENCDNTRVMIQGIRTEVADIKAQLAQSKNSTDLLTTVVANDSSLYQQIKNECNSKINATNENQDQKIAVMRSIFEEEMNDIRKDLIVSPSAIMQQNNDVMRRLESASLDGTNAMLKVNNMDMNIRIIEKKIENLAIMIKKIELQAQ